MKNSKVINFVSSLLTVLMIAFLSTSCNKADLTTSEIPQVNQTTKADLITSEIPQVNQTTLAEKLANNENFQASIKMHQQIGNDLMKFIKDNPQDITKDERIMADFINSNKASEEEFASYKTNLLNDLPELKSITEEAFGDALYLAHELLNEQELGSRSCATDFDSCIHSTYLDYIQGSSTYMTYYIQYIYCAYQYYYCLG